MERQEAAYGGGVGVCCTWWAARYTVYTLKSEHVLRLTVTAVFNVSASDQSAYWSKQHRQLLITFALYNS